jgi:DNA-binding XRE family transcriptional regulator
MQQRLNREFSRERLARVADVSSRTIYNIERGLHEPRPITKIALARALGCDVGDLFPTKSEAPVTSGDLAKLGYGAADRGRV